MHAYGSHAGIQVDPGSEQLYTAVRMWEVQSLLSLYILYKTFPGKQNVDSSCANGNHFAGSACWVGVNV